MSNKISGKNTNNKMGVVPVKSLLLTMGLPMVISMMFQAFYNIVDSYFVSCMADTAEISNMGDLAINALTLAFPVQMLMIAIGVGTGVGINALLSKSLGQRNFEKAGKIAGNAVFIGACTYVIFLIIGLTQTANYIGTQTNNIFISQMGSEYLGICMTLSFGVILFMLYEKLLQASGMTHLSTAAQLAGAVTNMILDPILIFGYFNFPQMGIKGAAYATVIGQCVSLMLGMFFHYRHNREIAFHFRYFLPDKLIIKEIYQIALPAIAMQALMSFMTYGVNLILLRVSTTAVTAYGVYYKIQQFVFFAAFGLNNAIIPIVSFNYGKRDKVRIKEGIRYGIGYTLIIMLIGAIGLQIFAESMVNVFSLAEETKQLCVTAIRILSLGYLFAGANIALQGILQAMGHGMQSLFLSLLRLIIVALPLLWVLSFLSNAEHWVWVAFPIAEGIALIYASGCLKMIFKKTITKMNDESLTVSCEPHPIKG